jgi:hypothetical protein
MARTWCLIAERMIQLSPRSESSLSQPGSGVHKILDKDREDPREFRLLCNYRQNSLRVRAWVNSSTRFASTAEDNLRDDRVYNSRRLMH